ncbi:MAG: helix-turn-helix domain-containing protein, partial [Gammaproteobacteria bacterium]|nr:helix-turn-helix domain-containing protein [Gammaproteobacteria bacterium]
MAKKRPPRSATPGKLLREQRELSGWSRAEVAWALCLAERQLRALEADDYANLPGRAYILGYWRNYANLLGVSIDHAIDAHKSGLPPRGARIALRAESRQAHGVLEQARQRWALAFGAAAVVFLAALWVWQGADDGLSLALPSLSPGADWRKWPGAVEESPPAAPAWNGA